ncbi:TcaA NTF2-like domain-containing protein [Rossellomorea sp. NS-SX7]|uniref:TcaA NTF2-like domain-containing protein n=1 Tax=Rossellomorea sp. NS-SX7 TaxID=3463856 RepID=UPI0040597590
MSWKEGFRKGMQHWIELSSKDNRFKQIEKDLRQISEDLEDELLVMVAGEFNSGKTTFINALLGEKVLSSNVTPETAMVTKLKFGMKKKVIGHFTDGTTKEYEPSWLDELTAEREGKSKFIRSKLAYVEYYLPSPILKTFTIVDSPGLTSLNKDHTRATEQFLKRADVAIWLFHSLNVGTSTELEWLKKLQDYEIKPIGIVNRIDQLDDEEDELESFLDFNLRRLYPLIDELVGVSAKEALNGIVEKDKKMVEWSNWSAVEKLFQDLKGQSDQKIERILQKLKEPIDLLDRMLLKEKSSYSLQRNFIKIKDFHSTIYPSLAKEKEQVLKQHQETKQLNADWITTLGTLKYNTSPGAYVDSIVSPIKDPVKRKMIKDQWDKVLPKLQSYEKNMENHQQEYERLLEENNSLETEWSNLSRLRLFGVSKVEQYSDKQDKFNRRVETFTRKRQVLMEEKRKLENVFRNLDRNIQSIIQSDFDERKIQIEERTEKWNEQVKEIKISYKEITLSYTEKLTSFFDWIYSFIHQVKSFFFTVDESITPLLAYEQVQRSLEDIEELYDDFPYSEFKDTLASFLSLPHLKMKTYEKFNIPGMGTRFIPSIQIPLVVSLKHDPGSVKRTIKDRREKWIGITVCLVVLSVFAYLILEDPNNSQGTSSFDDASYMDDEADSNTIEQMSYEEESQTELESLFDRSAIQDFLTRLHNEMENPTGSLELLYSEYFTDEGWEGFIPYHEKLTDGDLVKITGEEIEYSSDEINVTTTEYYSWEEAERTFKVHYSFIQDRFESNKLKINQVSYSIENETINPYIVDEQMIYSFMNEYRSDYMQALNSEDFSYVEPYFFSDTEEHQEMEEYFSSIEGKGYRFEFGENQVSNIEKTDDNQYTVSSFETFTFIDDKGIETYFERTKEYVLRAVADNDLLIDDIIIQDTKKQVVENDMAEASFDDLNAESEGNVQVSASDVSEMLLRYYDQYEEAFNNRGFSYVEHYFEPDSERYMEEKKYLTKAITKKMQMNNLSFEVKSMNIVDSDTYLATVHLEDEYQYQDKPTQKKKVRVEYLINVTSEEGIEISDMPYFDILETTTTQ